MVKKYSIKPVFIDVSITAPVPRKIMNALVQELVWLHRNDLKIYNDPFDKKVDSSLGDVAKGYALKFVYWIMSGIVLFIFYQIVRSCQG